MQLNAVKKNKIWVVLSLINALQTHGLAQINKDKKSCWAFKSHYNKTEIFMHCVWVLSEQYYPEQTSTGRLITQTAEGLAEQFCTHAISGPPTDRLVRTKAPSYEIRHGVEIYRCQGTVLDKNRLLGRAINIITQSLSIFFRALRMVKAGDAVLVVTNPPLLPFIALAVCYIKRAKLVLLIHDVYPEALVASGIVSAKSKFIGMLDWLHRYLYRSADRIVTLGRDMSDLVNRRLKMSNMPQDMIDKKIHCIPHWAEIEDVFPSDRNNNPLLQKLGIGQQFVVLYAGNLGRTHAIESLAEAATQLRHESIHILVLGPGVKRKWLETRIREQQLSNITMLPMLPADQINDALNACDVGLILFVPGMAGISVPSRMYNQMATAKPIIGMCDTASELAQVLTEEQAGWVIPPGDTDALVKCIRYAAKHPETCRIMGQQASNAVQQKYTFKQANKAYQTLFAQLFNAPS